MARWRDRLARRRMDRGGAAAFAGFFVAGLFVALGVICLVMVEIPIGTRGEPIWVGGFRKNAFGYCFLSIAAALHFGFFWTRVASLRTPGGIGLLVALASAGFFFFATFG